MTTSSNNPYFKLFPLNNARTGFKPYAMPVLYVERNRLDNSGLALGDSETQKLRYYIVDAPDSSKVAGPFNSNLRVPNSALFEIDVTEKQLSEHRIFVSSFTFYRKTIDLNGKDVYTVIDFSEAITGDYFEYGLDYNSVSDKVEYYADAYYYDLSNIQIEVEGLPKPKRYFFVWEATFFRRISTLNGNIKCISTDLGISNEILEVNHPGEVHHAMLKGTPALYFNYEGYNESTDPTLEFYRPFADILQDVFDEQKLLDGINHIDSVPAAFIPYLAYLIGWDLPNYPGVSDNLRRQILKRAVHLQKLKGSKRAINELFEMFGFTVNIINLWANKTGDKLLSQNDGISSSQVIQLDQLLSNYTAAGFSAGVIPLTFIPNKNAQIVVYAYQVKEGTDDYQKLIDFSNNLSSNLEYYNDNVIRTDINGVAVTKSIEELNTSFTDGLIGSNKVLIDGNDYQIYGRKVINHVNISYNKNENTIFLNFDHELSVDGGKVFTFVVYERTKLIIPNELFNTRSSRFDIEILNKENNPIDYNLLLYMLSFIFKLKAFHSLLRKIKYTIDLYEIYNVIDFCLSGNDILKPGTDLGDLQIPPAIIPIIDGICESTDRGFKQSDIDIKNTILDGLENEFQGWKNQTTINNDGNQIGSNCELNKDGQDKVFPSNVDYDHNEDDRKTYCEELVTKPDFCYKGRVNNELLIATEAVLKETYINVPCGPKLGYGVYWEEKSKVDYDHQNRGFLKSRLTFVDNKNVTLHYSAYPYYDFSKHTSQNTLALNPASLEIEKEHLGFPSHRFLSIAYLLNDYNYTSSNESYGHDVVRKRPWDENSKCGNYENLLNAILSEINGESVRIEYDGSYFNIVSMFTGIKIKTGFSSYNDASLFVNLNNMYTEQNLSWDDNDLIYVGNGISSEIDSLSDHSIQTGDNRLITHNVYQNTTINPYVQDDFTITTLARISCATDYGKIFDSACDDTNEDYIGGYASETNIIGISGNYRFDSADVNGFIDRSALTSAFEIPLNPIKSDARFFGKSMLFVDKNDVNYRYVKPYRLDCSCLLNDCDPTGDVTYSNDSCNTESLFDQDGNLDPSPDKLEFEFTNLLIEKISTCSRLSNNEIRTLFCINDDCTLPETGSFRYKDDYDIIYETLWITVNDLIDITFVTKDPRIPGVEPSGFIKDGRVYRKGVITTIRQIFKGSIVEGEGVEQIVGYYQSNVRCGDIAFENPFAYGIDCAIQDEVEFEITDGPMWMDPNDVGPDGLTLIEFENIGTWKTDGTVWADAVLEGSEVFFPTQNPQVWIDFVTKGEVQIDPIVEFSSSTHSLSSKSSESTKQSSSSSLSSISSKSLSSISSKSLSSISSKSLSSISSEPSDSSVTSESFSESTNSSQLSESSISLLSNSTESTEPSSDSSNSVSDSSQFSSSDSSQSSENTSNSSNSSDSSQSSVSTLSSSDSSQSSNSILSFSDSTMSNSSSSGTLPIGLFMAAGGTNVIESVIITTLGNSSSFGNVSSTGSSGCACSSATRMVYSSAYDSLTTDNVYVDYDTGGIAIDFGELSVARDKSSAVSNSTRGIFNGGASPFTDNTIDYITIATTGNATDFGDMSSYGRHSAAACSDTTRGIIGGGQDTNYGSNDWFNTIEYVTIATTGNATSFGNLTTPRREFSACSSSTRGVFASGYGASPPPSGLYNTIDYVTIATTGDATDFGDLFFQMRQVAGCSSHIRGLFAGGAYYIDPTHYITNVIQYITIATTSNTSDFGDLMYEKARMASCSNVHGGLP